jgi:hypothetical protein
MKWNRAWFVGLLLVFRFTFAAVLVFQLNAAGPGDLPSPEHRSVDWSHRHLIYSGPPKGPNAWAAMQDPRYLRYLSMYGDHESRADEHWTPNGWRDAIESFLDRHHERSPLQRDWQFNLGTNAVVGPFNSNDNGYSFPAKFTFDINATPSCINDFVVFTTASPGATGGQASIVALNQLYSGSGPGGTSTELYIFRNFR